MIAVPALPEPGVHPRRVVRRVLRRPAAPALPPAPEPQEPRLLRPAATCPRCGARPAMRVTDAIIGALAGHPGDERVGTYQCQRRGCGAIYDLTASAYLQAS
ncbi:hypothetical protein [Longimicrobium sp.]|uniref:hypothetical protein n=1 Tax=Longimicrobium sp. TaxID=2029185 RepID=UPI002CC19046|nr:hypothetical protein [Longimicrobium sp.]HSU17863.1 hypothetical protein [Longimicrobium sp.]